jgi:hypothetical protein
MALASGRDDHPDYRECTDADCPRYPCRIYREGFRDGRDVGRREGYAEGYPDGYIDGYAAGASAATASR